MSCDRCEDIHLGQRFYGNQNPCQCSCHGFQPYIVTCGPNTITLPTYTINDAGGAATVNTSITYDTTGCNGDACAAPNLNLNNS